MFVCLFLVPLHRNDNVYLVLRVRKAFIIVRNMNRFGGMRDLANFGGDIRDGS